MGPPDANAPEARPYKPPPAASTSTYQRRPWPQALDRRCTREPRLQRPLARRARQSAARTSAQATRPRRRRAPRPLRRRHVDASGTRLRHGPGETGGDHADEVSVDDVLTGHAARLSRPPCTEVARASCHGSSSAGTSSFCGVALARTRSGGSERVTATPERLCNGRATVVCTHAAQTLASPRGRPPAGREGRDQRTPGAS